MRYIPALFVKTPKAIAHKFKKTRNLMFASAALPRLQTLKVCF
jgi:hypothetical protein